jgi:hypothetical protein
MPQFTIEIQVGDADRMKQLQPAENVTDAGDAEQVAFDAVADRNVLALDDAGDWQIAVWDGADADTATPPTFLLTAQGYRDLCADVLDRAEEGRQAAEAEYEPDERDW